MRMPLYLTLDQGGHASRCLIFSASGEVVAAAERAITTLTPQPFWVEHDAEELVRSVYESQVDALTQLGPAAQQIVAAGLATQRSSIVAWDRLTGAALTPVISWQDRRAAEWLQTNLHEHTAEISARTGLPLSPHYGASKLRWCLDHVAAVQAARDAKRLCLGPLASFLIYRLTNEHRCLADPANASRTLLWNIHQRGWDPWLCDQFGIAQHLLPDSVPSHFPFGTLMSGEASEHAIPLSLVMGDQAAALYGQGLPQPECIYINLGTGAFIQHVAKQGSNQDLAPIPGLLTSVVYDSGETCFYSTEATVNGAGAALQWFGAEFQQPDWQEQSAQWLLAPEPTPLFMNGVGGVGSPFWFPALANEFIGAGTLAQRFRAVMESILFLLQTNLQLLQSARPNARHLLVSGGLSQSDWFCQRLANLNQRTVQRSDVSEATARGLFTLLPNTAQSMSPLAAAQVFTPTTDPLLAQRYQQWRVEMAKRAEANRDGSRPSPG